MSSYNWDNAVWDSVPAYHLTKEIVNAYLQDIFGYWDFSTEVRNLQLALVK